MSAVQTSTDYWNESAPWWKALNTWENDKPLSKDTLILLQKIKGETADRRTRQLCHFLLRLASDEAEMTHNNDSFTQYLLKRRNAQRLRKRLA